MPWVKAGSSAVIVAKQFNPSILNHGWLMKHGILDDDELEQGSVFLDMMVQVRSRRFSLVAIPQQLQFVPAPTIAGEEEQRLILDKLGEIARKLPETPYKGLGINFSWHLVPTDGDTNRATRDLFFRQDRPIYSVFDASDARFGAYLSKDFAGFRLKLDIKPITLQVGEQTQHRVLFQFNFHVDLGEEPAAQIVERLGHWNEVRLESERIVDTIELRQMQ